MPTPTQLALIGAYFVVIGIIIGVFLYLRKRQSTDIQQAPQQAQAGAGAAARRQPRRQQVGGEARAAPVPAGAAAAAARDPDADGDDDEEEVEDEKLTGATAKQRKKMEKLARQQAREDQRRVQDDKAEARARKEAERVAIREKKEEERNAVLKALEDEAAARRAEELKAQEAEFEEWKDMITVDTAGSGESDVMTESQGLLQEFIDYIKKKKVVVLDDVASEFNLKTQDVVNRIEVLEKSGMISGVLDDRGKFIFITPEELDAVANFIKRRGRVSITDVVSESNKLIDLTVRETITELDDLDNKENKNNDTQDVVHEIQF